MKITQKLISASKYSLKCPYEMTPTRIVVHNTANDASAQNEIAYMQKNNNAVSFHYAVDDKEVVQGIPENRNTWNAGDGNGPGNRQGIAIEICYSKSGGQRFDKAEANAAKLIAQLLQKYNWSIDKVTKHQEYSNKYCPHRTLDLGWDRFLKMINQELGNKEVKDQILNKGEKFTIPGVFKVTKANAKLDAIACAELTGQPFKNYNYIDALPLIKTDKNKNVLDNQILDEGDYFIIPGTFTVLKVDIKTDAIYAKIGRRKTWIKAGPCYEI